MLTYYDWGIQLEADPAHGELVIEALGLEGAKSVATPGVAEASEIGSAELSARRREATTEGMRADAQEADSSPLSEAQAHEYLSIGARMNLPGDGQDGHPVRGQGNLAPSQWAD